MKAIDLRKLPHTARRTDFLDSLKVGQKFEFFHVNGRTMIRSLGIVTASEPGGAILADVPRIEALPTTGRIRISPTSGISASTKKVRKGMPEIRVDRFAIVVEQFTSGLAVEVHGPITAALGDSFKVGDQWFNYRERGRSSFTIYADGMTS